jgi:hypothetical protein
MQMENFLGPGGWGGGGMVKTGVNAEIPVWEGRGGLGSFFHEDLQPKYEITYISSS